MHAPKSGLAATPKKIYLRATEKHRSVRISILKGREQRESPNNLSLYKWHHDLPTPDEDAGLVLLARSGDPKAQRQLVANYQRLIHSAAGKRRLNHRFKKGGKVHTNEAFDELVARGYEALWKAVLRYDPSMGPFSAYAKLCISGQMSEESKAFVKRGLVSETRTDRWLFSHPHATPEQMVAALRRKGKKIDLWEAKAEIRAFKSRHSFTEYRDEYLEASILKSNRRPSAQ